MTEAPARPAARSLPQPHGFWWLHDARWYQGVRKRYGAEAANEINAEAIHFVARRVARWYTSAFGLDVDTMPAAELAAQFEEMLRVMWPEEMTRLEQRVIGPDEFETVMTDHFAVRMLRAARSLDVYECPCLDMRAGVFEGMGLKACDRLVECQRTGGDACRFRTVIQRDDDSPSPPDQSGTES